MTQVTQAIYDNGVLRPLEKILLKDQERVELSIRPIEAGNGSEKSEAADPLDSLRADTGIKDLAEHFDDYRFGPG